LRRGRSWTAKWSRSINGEHGRPSFNLLQNYRPGKIGLYYYVFDLLAYQGKSLLALPLRERRALLRSRVFTTAVADPVRFSETLQASADELIRAAKAQGLEGIIAKRTTSLYEPGKRSGTWVKFKINKGQELVIGGYRAGKNYFDNLAVGYYEGKKLMFIAKLKNGFTPQMKRDVAARFKDLETDVCPFANLPEPKNARRGEALTAEAMKNYRWLKPEVVAQVEFTDWTDAKACASYCTSS
jgi:ATP-dependent DNA ligase